MHNGNTHPACEDLRQLSGYIIYTVNNENNTYQKYGVGLYTCSEKDS